MDSMLSTWRCKTVSNPGVVWERVSMEASRIYKGFELRRIALAQSDFAWAVLTLNGSLVGAVRSYRSAKAMVNRQAE